MTKIAVLLCAVLAFAAAPSSANEDAGQKGPCKADYEKFCKDVKPGEGRIVKCMKEHESDLSEACKAKIAERKAKRQAAKADFEKSCGGDVKSLCGDVKPGRGAVLKCLKQNEAKVSEGCKSFLAEKKQERQERRKKWKERRAEKAGADSQDSGAKTDEPGAGGSPQ